MAKRNAAPLGHPDLFAAQQLEAGLLQTSPDSRLIPYGKYKQQPYEVMLNDPEYAMWLMSSQYAKLKQMHPAFFGFLLGRFGLPERPPCPQHAPESLFG